MTSPRAPTAKLLEICRITPPPESRTKFSLPLTFFDTFWLRSPPVERIFFYTLSSAATSEFQATAVPRLKRSLSLALLHFLPLAGNLTWPADADVPFILYTPGDGVSVTIAESIPDDDFDLLPGDGPRDAILSRAYVPKLAVSGPKAAVLALQITLFPNKGFCIGVTSHHAVVDGKSIVMFLKAWAHISRNGWCDEDDGSLPEEFTPFLDRTVVKDPEGIALEDVKTWMAIGGGGEGNRRSLELLTEGLRSADQSNHLVQATFKLSKQDVRKLKQNAISQLESNNKKQLEITPSAISTFVITYAHTLVCMAKAKGLEDNQKVFFGFTADCRSRLEPPLPSNYFGNCVAPIAAEIISIGDLVHETGVAYGAQKLVEAIRRLEKDVLVEAKGKLARILEEAAAIKEGGLMGVGVAGSPRFGVYSVDFGYGRPEKVEITSIDKTLAMSMAESGDGGGGVEIGVVMEKHEMEEFTSAFNIGLKDF